MRRVGCDAGVLGGALALGGTGVPGGIDVACVFDVAVVGAGPAGLAAAVAACQAGAARVMVIEREEFAGGVLPQCVHDGFGLHVHGVALTGPQYAHEWHTRAREAGAAFVLGTTVLSITRDEQGFAVEAVGAALGGHARLQARSVVVATGCRERTRGALGIPGTRPAGVMTAGIAQYMVNIENQLPGDKVVILGSGDIGLIMARRLTLEGAQVRLVLGQQATGLLRNHVRCIEDFHIPIRYGWGLASVHGKGRLKGVTVAPMCADGSFDMAARQYVRCNLLLLACGLIPEREVMAGLDGVGAADGLFICGNADHPHDLADAVTQEGLRAGAAAAAFSRGVDVACALAALPGETRQVLRRRVVEPKGRLADLTATGSGRGDDTQRLVACTQCPTGCVVRVDAQGMCTGNACERGVAFAQAELRCPMRTFTGTVRVYGSYTALVPVRTRDDVPAAELMNVAAACRRIVVDAPVASGDVLCADVAHTGASLIACTDAPACGGDA